jgi:hypothetical protein
VESSFEVLAFKAARALGRQRDTIWNEDAGLLDVLEAISVDLVKQEIKHLFVDALDDNQLAEACDDLDALAGTSVTIVPLPPAPVESRRVPSSINVQQQPTFVSAGTAETMSAGKRLAFALMTWAERAYSLVGKLAERITTCTGVEVVVSGSFSSNLAIPGQDADYTMSLQTKWH